MLQTFENTRPYAQPLASIKAVGDWYSMPPDFVEGLVFLKRFLRRPTRPETLIETAVHLLDGTLYALTNSLIVEYEVGETSIPDLSFGPTGINTLGAFATAPSEIVIKFDDVSEFLFSWTDGQRLSSDTSWNSVALNPVSVGRRAYRRVAKDAFDRFWRFHQGVALDDETRTAVMQMHGGTNLANDIFVNGRGVVSRMSSDRERKVWTSQTHSSCASNAERTMRFERKAFLDMIRVADEIDFSVSPVCFRHPHGRGMLIERTLGSDTPEFEVSDG